MKHHDGFYKRILSCRQMVSSYLLDYVHAGFVADMDMATLELVSGSFVSDDLHSRENDVIWKVKWRGADAYLYVMIEAQRKRDSLMAVRLLNYTTALWLQLRDSGTASRETGLPPVFPLVLYSGEEPWNEPFDLSSLLSPRAESVLELQPGTGTLCLTSVESPRRTLQQGQAWHPSSFVWSRPHFLRKFSASWQSARSGSPVPSTQASTMPLRRGSRTRCCSVMGLPQKSS